jgi:hypothetical protein
MIMFIFTIALDLFAQVVLDDAVRNAVRQVQIGAITSGTAFKTAVCSEFTYISGSCQNALQYDVQGASSFGSMSPATLNSNGILSASGGSTPITNFSGVLPTASGAPVFILAQVAFLVPFKFINVANGVVAQNGTPSLYSAVAVAAEF